MPIAQLTEIGDDVALIIPDEVLARLRLREGDTLYWVEVPEGIRLTTCDPAVGAKADPDEER